MSSRDAQDLRQFGYAQELLRSMGGFSNFAISFSIISILTGAVTLYGYGLEMGGPLQMTLGWPLATVFTLTLAASMAELCSAYPTSGAMYHWAAALGGPAWGWFAAWLNIIGLDRGTGRHQLRLRPVRTSLPGHCRDTNKRFPHVRVHARSARNTESHRCPVGGRSQ